MKCSIFQSDDPTVSELLIPEGEPCQSGELQETAGGRPEQVHARPVGDDLEALQTNEVSAFQLQSISAPHARIWPRVRILG
mmetsp:Transcript_61377/g.133370  ORF Transcript_61377/g.133370 Transcript_61377/m.133370 type:complete len:81 (-) Transcript_61377:102-344(-)